MRILLMVSVLALLGGCGVVRVNGDYFQPQAANLGRFEDDNRACARQASDGVDYDARAIAGTESDHNRAYNAAYRRCMAARGDRPRPYWRNFLPQ